MSLLTEKPFISGSVIEQIKHQSSIFKPYYQNTKSSQFLSLKNSFIWTVFSMSSHQRRRLFFQKPFTKKELDLLDSRYDIIEVTKEEQFTLGTNVLSIGNRKII